MKCFTIFSILCLIATPVCAEVAIELIPGQMIYSGPGGQTMSVETIPGMRQFSGAVDGTAVDLAPGVTAYDLRPNGFADIEQRSRENGSALEQMFKEDQRHRAELDRQHQDFMNRLRNGSSR